MKKSVRATVMRRARGRCEYCNKRAKFKTKQGKHYLEMHHIQPGRNQPRWIGAICSNCHSRIHYGKKGHRMNQKLMKKLSPTRRFVRQTLKWTAIAATGGSTWWLFL